ncbi:hypothetical protein MNBD_BACTEROID01-2149 [hydrothermal vent metagenome]|uniref:Uncharacterized protein n=1 Tax=hydrothermal vent metagenome TaxID=652676 RepID=A0A3B0U5Z6_9ZZZZ
MKVSEKSQHEAEGEIFHRYSRCYIEERFSLTTK